MERAGRRRAPPRGPARWCCSARRRILRPVRRLRGARRALPRTRGGCRRRASKSRLMPRRKQQQPLEHRLLLTATLCLLAGGAVMVYSASSARTLLQGDGDGTAYLIKYLVYGAVGLVLMQVLARHGLASVRRYTPVPAADRVRPAAARADPGLRREDQRRPPLARRRPAPVPALGDHEARARPARGGDHRPPGRSSRSTCAPRPDRSSASAAAAILLVAAQPDLGTALVISFTLGAMLVAAGCRCASSGWSRPSARSSCSSSRCSSPTGARA